MDWTMLPSSLQEVSKHKSFNLPYSFLQPAHQLTTSTDTDAATTTPAESIATRLREPHKRTMAPNAVEAIANAHVQFNAIEELLQSSTSWQDAWNNGDDKTKDKIKMLVQQGIEDDSPDPKNRKEAMESEDAQLWLQAEAEELQSHHHHKTFILEERKPWMKKIWKSRPVYRRSATTTISLLGTKLASRSLPSRR